ncbi:hypothetical protein CDL15_Pgr015981 [Punica granatum]|nr:hypothetical protein CDL15_Pgr015980 [Punica granatum]OWM86945.1 hypothetical protein CDL15_Pgr015981 [Punica granatum]
MHLDLCHKSQPPTMTSHGRILTSLARRNRIHNTLACRRSNRPSIMRKTIKTGMETRRMIKLILAASGAIIIRCMMISLSCSIPIYYYVCETTYM